MNYKEKAELLNLLYLLSYELQKENEKNRRDTDETLDEAIKTLICYLD